MANRIFQRYNNLLNEATFLRQYYNKSYITDLKQTFIKELPGQDQEGVPGKAQGPAGVVRGAGEAGIHGERL